MVGKMKPSSFHECVLERTTKVDVLDEQTMWSTHGPLVFQANSFAGDVNFYPVYQWEDFYSFSYLALLVKKGTLNLRQNLALQGRETPLRPDELPDLDIRRIGGVRKFTKAISDPDEYCRLLSKAMIDDVRAVEKRNPDARHFVLCGGKDSLNILLLPWATKPTAVSANPNFPLVRKFVDDNDLDIDVIELKDSVDAELRDWEIAEAACQVDLQHWRWTPHLRQIVQEQDSSAIFWKGQLADVTLTNFWRGYTHLQSKSVSLALRVHKRLMSKFPNATSPLDPMVIKHLEESFWYRGAVAQGSHVGFLRSICDALFLSAYHGPAVSDVMFAADLPKVTGRDLRVDMGEIICGKNVIYPAENPAPGPSVGRENTRSLAVFCEAVKSFGVEVKQ